MHASVSRETTTGRCVRIFSPVFELCSAFWVLQRTWSFCASAPQFFCCFRISGLGMLLGCDFENITRTHAFFSSRSRRSGHALGHFIIFFVFSFCPSSVCRATCLCQRLSRTHFFSCGTPAFEFCQTPVPGVHLFVVMCPPLGAPFFQIRSTPHVILPHISVVVPVLVTSPCE